MGEEDPKRGPVSEPGELSERSVRAAERHAAAAHAMQTGVAYDLAMDSSSGTPKHLRVGVNAAMSDHYGLVKLLISKGVITEEEYLESIADAMEEEKARYEVLLLDRYGASVSLV